MLRELFHTSVAWLVIFPSAYLLGSFWEYFVPRQDRVVKGILFCALGLATFFAGVTVLSACHCLQPPFLWGMLFLPLLLRIRKLGDWFGWLADLGKAWLPPPGFFPRALFLLFAVSFLGLLLGTLSPELGGDSLCYQLNIPKACLMRGSVEPNYLDYNSYYPLFMNHLYLIGLAVGGVFTAKLFHFFCGFLLFAAIQQVLRNATGSWRLSFFCALAVWTTPTVYNLLSTTYVDVALAFYTFIATMVLTEALENGGRRYFFLAGLLAGCGIAVKYLCLISVLAWGAVWLYSLLTTRRYRMHAGGAAWFILGMLAVTGYWFARNGVLTGNPLFPYLGRLFGGQTRPQADFYDFGLGKSVFHFLSLYFNMFLLPDFFGTRTTRIGLFYFLFVPFVLIGMARDRRARGYGIFWLAFTGIIFLIGQADRWILPVLPVMAVCGGLGFYGCYTASTAPLRKVLRVGVFGTALLGLSVYAAAGVYHYRFAYRLFTGSWTPEKYLQSLERTTGISTWANRHLPANAGILAISEARLFYFHHPVVRYFFLAWRYKDPSWADPAAFAGFLKSQGLTHILISAPVSAKVAASPVPAEIDSLLGLPTTKKIYETCSENIREERYRYSLYELGGRGEI
jgi:hypothetical protein